MIKDDISSPRRYITFVQDITRVLPTLVRRFRSHPAIIARRHYAVICCPIFGLCLSYVKG